MNLFSNNAVPFEDDLSDQQEPLLAFEKFINDIQSLKISKNATRTRVTVRLMLVFPVIMMILVLVLFFNRPRTSQKLQQTSGLKAKNLRPEKQTPSVALFTKEPPGSIPSTVAELPPADQISDSSPAKTVRQNLKVEKPVKKNTAKSSKPSAISRQSFSRSSEQPRKTDRFGTSKSAVAAKTPKNPVSSSNTATDPSPDIFSPDQIEFAGQVDRTAFYLPAGSDKPTANSTRQSKKDPNSGKSSQTTMNSDTYPVIQNKIQVIRQITQRHEGVFGSTLEHNGDYYKVKLFIPETNLDSFKKTIAQKVEYASFTRVSEESTRDKICVILETHAK